LARKQVEEFVSKTKKAEPLTPQRAEAIVRNALKQLERADENDVWDKLGDIDSHCPSQSLAAGLLSLVASDCFNAPPKTRIVYSSLPTRQQRSLPAGAKPLIDRYVRESKALAGVLERLRVPERLEELEFGQYSDLLTSGAPQSPVKLALITVVRDLDSLGLVVELDGRLIGHEGILLFEKNWSRPQKDQTALDVPFRPGPLTVEAAKARAVIRDAGRPVQEQEAAARFSLNRLMKLDERDLHADFTTEALTQISEALKLDAVVRLSDGWLLLGLSLDRLGTMTLSRIMTAFGQMAPLKGSDGWLYTEPEVGTGWPPLKRRGLQAFAKSVSSHGLGLDALADLAAHCDDDLEFDGMWRWASDCVPGGPSRFSGSVNFPALRLYGSLDDYSRKLAKSGGIEIMFGTAPPRLKAALHRLVWYVHPMVSDKDTHRESGTAEEGQDDGETGSVTEPTTLLPNGIPPDTRMTFKFSDDERWFMMVQGRTRATVTSGGLEEIAEELASRSVELPELFARARIGKLTRQILTVEARFTDKLFWGSESVLNPWVSGDSTLPVQQMPPDFKAAFDTALSKAREEAKSAPVRREKTIP
jgi:hypothetical protein